MSALGRGALAALLVALAALPLHAQSDGAGGPGASGGPGLALRAAKVLTAAWQGDQAVDTAVVLVKDGRIEAVGPARTTPIPVGYVVEDVGSRWLMPGMIDLHSHIGGTFDINDMVYVTNPGLKVHGAVIPNNRAFQRALAAGVTAVLFIPGSGTNSGGQGVLLKTGLETYDESLIRDPGSLKVAQWGNPERWAIGVGKAFENWHIRDMFRRGLAYARAVKAWREGKGPKPERALEFDVFPHLLDKKTQVSVHTQIYQVVLTTLTMLRKEFGVDVYIDHGEWKGYLAAPMAEEIGVPAIIGPREIDWRLPFWNIDTDGQVQGIAAEYQKRGHTMIGFNTDAPVVPAEELSLQAGVAVRFGFDTSNMDAVRGLTIVPARTAGIDDRLGSLERGKDADILVVTGDPADPRSSVEVVFINGKRVYDTAVDRRRW
ncbi:MAG TPA: amidohydrolase family protein [Planctomycetota bacterium]|nr:amidohydrolase family protein [Planctomycetota bacterium]